MALALLMRCVNNARMKTQIFALLGLLAASNTLAFDIVGQGQSRYVKITRQDEWVGFEDCNVRDRNDCRQIGARKFYLVSEIEAQLHVEYL